MLGSCLGYCTSAPDTSFANSFGLVLRFICSVTYFLGRLCHGVVQFAEQCGEILSCEPPLEGFGDGLVVTPECQQALRQLLQGREIVGRQDLSLEDREIDFDLIEPTGVNGPVNEHQVGVLDLPPALRTDPLDDFSDSH